MAATDIEPHIIQLEPGDVEAGLALSDEAGWNQTPDDWSYFLSHGLVFGIREQGQIIATAALLPYPPGAWISLVLVTSRWRRQGLASALMQRCIEAAEERGLEAWLDATPAGAAVYEKMGFSSAACGLQRLRRQAVRGQTAAADAQAIDERALRQLMERDRRAMGFDRSAFLTKLAERRGTKLCAREGAVCVVRDGRRARHIGPMLADSEPDAIALIEQALRFEDGPLIMDVFERHREVLNCLLENGFTSERPFSRMWRGTPRHRDESVLLTASAGPEFG